MTFRQRDTLHHTYADYLTWPDGESGELIDGIRASAKLDERGVRGAPDWLAEVLSPSTARHDQVVKVPAHERAGVREMWLVHPTDRLLTIYRLENGRYGRPNVRELKGRATIGAITGVSSDWDLLT